ncbi:hypothetical protein FB480_103329 [Agrobacterium vitis]|nr:hypothetical protein FB480_103329 [Agrobacterium vitis]
MHDMIMRVGQALLMALGMAWKTGWTLCLGFVISSVLQTIVPAAKMQRYLGKGSAKEVALASAAGAASSSCSYASAAIMRTLFKKGADLVNALAFLVASTNLVLELGIILLILMGWQFMVAEWVGGLVMIALMTLLVKLTRPTKLIEEARQHEESGKGHEHGSMVVEGETWKDRLKNPQTPVRVAQNFAMEWSMLWKDLVAGFLIGGFIAVFVPDSIWQALFLTQEPGWVQVGTNALIGPVVAMLTFVCSIGNIPLAAVLFAGGASFGGVLAFIYADLLILPLIDAYRRYFGWKMALYMAAVLFSAMAVSSLLMELVFSSLNLVPQPSSDIRAQLTQFSIDYTFWLNLMFGAGAIWLFWLNYKNPMHHGHSAHHSHHHGSEDHSYNHNH